MNESLTSLVAQIMALSSIDRTQVMDEVSRLSKLIAFRRPVDPTKMNLAVVVDPAKEVSAPPPAPPMALTPPVQRIEPVKVFTYLRAVVPAQQELFDLPVVAEEVTDVPRARPKTKTGEKRVAREETGDSQRFAGLKVLMFRTAVWLQSQEMARNFFETVAALPFHAPGEGLDKLRFVQHAVTAKTRIDHEAEAVNQPLWSAMFGGLIPAKYFRTDKNNTTPWSWRGGVAGAPRKKRNEGEETEENTVRSYLVYPIGAPFFSDRKNTETILHKFLIEWTTRRKELGLEYPSTGGPEWKPSMLLDAPKYFPVSYRGAETLHMECIVGAELRRSWWNYYARKKHNKRCSESMLAITEMVAMGMTHGGEIINH